MTAASITEALVILMVYLMGMAPAFGVCCVLDAINIDRADNKPTPSSRGFVLLWPLTLFSVFVVGLICSWITLIALGFRGMRLNVYETLAQGGRTHAAEGKQDA